VTTNAHAFSDESESQSAAMNAQTGTYDIWLLVWRAAFLRASHLTRQATVYPIWSPTAATIVFGSGEI